MCARQPPVQAVPRCAVVCHTVHASARPPDCPLAFQPARPPPTQLPIRRSIGLSVCLSVRAAEGLVTEVTGEHEFPRLPVDCFEQLVLLLRQLGCRATVLATPLVSAGISMTLNRASMRIDRTILTPYMHVSQTI